MLGMSKQKRPGRKPDPESKRSAGVDRHTKPRESFHADEALLEAMRQFIAETRPRTNKSEVMRTALEEFLEKRGHWPPKPGNDNG